MKDKYIIIGTLMIFGIAALGASFTRKSTPPVKITDPNEIKWRTDICYGTERDSITNPESDGETSS